MMMSDHLLVRQDLKLLQTQKFPTYIRETSKAESILRRRKG
jgi:hypothetical protein